MKICFYANFSIVFGPNFEGGPSQISGGRKSDLRSLELENMCLLSLSSVSDSLVIMGKHIENTAFTGT